MTDSFQLPEPPRRTRRGRQSRSYAVLVVLPTVLVAAYLVLVAQPRYAATFSFSIYQTGSGGSGSAGGGGLPAGGASAGGGDLPTAAPTIANYVVADYLCSTQVIRDLERRMDLRAILDDPKGDLLGRYWWGDASPEELIRYWNNLTIDVDYDVTTGLTAVSVSTYSAENSRRIADALSRLSEAVVNDMSATARDDKVRFAEQALARADKRLQEILLREQALRNQQRTPDPASTAQAMLSYSDSLRQSIDAMRAEDDILGRTLGPRAPARQILGRQIAATESQLRTALGEMGIENGGSGAGGGGADNDGRAAGAPSAGSYAKLPQQMGAYEYLELERSFLSSFTTSLMQTLETARLDQATQHNYLESYVVPYVPMHPASPRPVLWTLLVFVGLSVCWLIGLLVVLSVRDHLPPGDATDGA